MMIEYMLLTQGLEHIAQYTINKQKLIFWRI